MQKKAPANIIELRIARREKEVEVNGRAKTECQMEETKRRKEPKTGHQTQKDQVLHAEA